MSLRRVISNVGHRTQTPLILPKGSYAAGLRTPRPAAQKLTLGHHHSYSTAPRPIIAKSRTYDAHIDHRELFVKALQTRRVDLVRRALLTLLQLSEGEPEPLEAYGTTRDELIALMSLLIYGGRSTDLSIIEKLLQSMESQWNFPVNDGIHSMIILHLTRGHGQVLSAIRWLCHIQEKPGRCRSLPQQWHMILERCRKDGQVGLAHTAVRSMRETGCPRTEETYKILFGIMFSDTRVPQFPRIHEVVQEMLKDKVPFTAQLRDAIMAHYRDRGHLFLSARVEELWETVKPLQAPKGDENPIPPHILVQNSEDSEATRIAEPTATSVDLSRDPEGGTKKVESRLLPVYDTEDIRRKEEILTDVLGDAGGKRKAVTLLRQYRDQGFVPSSSTLTAMSRSIPSLKELQFWQKTLGVDVEAEVFVQLIRHARTPFHALATYRTALLYTPPTLTLLHPLLSYLRHAQYGKPSKDTIDNALRLHADYVAHRKESDAGLDLNQPQKTSELATYSVLLRMLSSSSLADTYFSKTFDLVQEMRDRGLQMSGPVTASFIISLMKSSAKLSDAFKLYRVASKDRDGRLLLVSSEHFGHIIKAFCDLPFTNGLASVTYHFDFIQDVRDAKLPVTAEIYTTFLKYYGRSAASLPQNDTNTRQKHATVVRRLHDMITVDASLVPDIAMWNQLMDSYQRAGCFQEAIQLWKTMFMARKFDHASVSIVTDACAFAGAHQIAVDIYKQLHAANFRLNRRNWVNWLECLCRLGKFDEALKFVCLQMGRDGKTVAPDVDVVRLLLKFAIAENQVGETRTKLKTYLPDLWASLPRELKDM